MVRISAVSYLNTLPFIHGIENSGFLKPEDYILKREMPSNCALTLEKNEADLVLVPVAAIAGIKDINIISNYCIGANRNVLSVLLYSQNPISDIENIYLDYQSRTSVTLVKVLAKNLWKKEFNWLEAEPGYENKINRQTGGVIIGDRALELLDSFKYKIDLATAWNDLTGLPFVFACWVSKSKLDDNFIKKFNNSLEWGINNINQINPNNPNLSNEFIRNYFKNNIDYHFDDKKISGMNLFFKYIKSL
ncbi:MAG: menaquinone biosynthesis protein [Bacteroidia bacterium]|nr:menaquinone biosynthesis protein [Bacteroidia bacterium]